MRRILSLGLCIALVAGTLPVAWAQSNEDEAKAHYKNGEQFYLRGRYQEAIDEFQQAYKLSKAPALLYNISQAYERLGDLPKARGYLKQYIDSGNAEPSEMPALQDKLRVLDERIAESEKKPIVTPPEPSRPYKTWKWVAAGAGAAFLVVSLAAIADS